MEVLTRDLRGLSQSLPAMLAKLGQLDAETHRQTLELARREDSIILQLQLYAIQGIRDFDEKALRDKFEAIAIEREQLLARHSVQIVAAKAIYDFLDEKIAYIDHKTMSVVAAGRALLKSQEEKRLRQEKRRRKKTEDNVLEEVPAPAVDPLAMTVNPNEPVYCLCQRISYGEMVACDDEDCPIEWFHFGCVGLVETPSDPWYCPNCISKHS